MSEKKTWVPVCRSHWMLGISLPEIWLLPCALQFAVCATIYEHTANMNLAKLKHTVRNLGNFIFKLFHKYDASNKNMNKVSCMCL